mmetsp:Transcript_38878/g.89771  ORF Transcript_38878/g.89771 Transcript_38878/m.89771 type:complete len:360 (+) Transcript_38878:25-1104(+)
MVRAAHGCTLGAHFFLPQEHVGGNDRVWIERHGIDALLHQPLGQVRVVRGALATDSNILALGLRCLYQGFKALHDSRVPLVEVLGHQARVAIKTKRQLGQIVAANGESIKVLQELVCQEDIAGKLSHHVPLQAVLAASKTILLENLVDVLGHIQGSHKRDHDLDVGQAHLSAHLLDCIKLHGEALLKEGIRVAAATTEANHWVLLVRLVLVSTNEALVLIGLEVRQADNDLLGVHGACKGRNTLGNLLHVEVLRAVIPTHLLLNDLLGLCIHGVQLKQGLWVHADGIVDHKLQSCQANSVAWQLAKRKGRLGVANIHHDLHVHLWNLTDILLRALELQQALVNAASVTLSTADSHLITL